MNYSCSIFPPQAVPCGDYGTCQLHPSEGTWFCNCISGYSSIGDFSVFVTNPCDINLTAIRVLWGFTLLSVLLAYAVSAWGLMSRRAAGILKWKAWRLWIVPYLVIVGSSFLLVMSLGKIIDPALWNVGTHTPMTLLHGFCATVTATFLVIGLNGITRTAYQDTLRGKSSADRLEMKLKMRRIETGMALFWIFACVCAFLPVASLINANDVWWSTLVHGCGFAVELLVLGTVVAPVNLKQVIDKVQESISNNRSNQSNPNAKMLRVLAKLRAGRRMASIGSTVMSICIVIFVAWPFLVVKASYVLPLIFIVVECSGVALIWVTTTTNALNLGRKPSLALKRLSVALSSAGTAARKSLEKRQGDRRVSMEQALLPSTPAPESPI